MHLEDRARHWIAILWLTAFLGGVAPVSAGLSEYTQSPDQDPHFREKNQAAARQQQELFRVRVAVPDAVRDDVPLASDAVRSTPTPARPSAPATQPANNGSLVLGVALLGALFLCRKPLSRILRTAQEESRPTETSPVPVRAEEAALVEFLAALHGGPSQAGSEEDVSGGEVATWDAMSVTTFRNRATHRLATMRQLLPEIERSQDELGRRKLLEAFRWELHALKDEAAGNGLLPAWQLSLAQEGLLKQLTDRARNVTPSTLRTVAGGLTVLEELCQPGAEADLLSRCPLRFLAVDDDPISRKAVSLALQRALAKPDLAENGEAALTLVSQQPYDVIFLDVEMPGMDGFELCSRIRATPVNPATPVVFITGHTDFEARAQSALVGGTELLGKPFLTFEITVKALSLALRRRLSQHEQERVLLPPVEIPTPSRQPSEEVSAATDSAQASQSFAVRLDISPTPANSLPPSAPSVDEIATSFLTRASAHLAPLRDTFQAVFQTVEEAERQEMLAEVYLRLHSFSPNSNFPLRHPAMKLSAALEGLLRKLLEQPRHATVSTLVTLAAGVDLFSDLCELPVNSTLMTTPPIQMLVVDDDPVARRAVVCALQMAFDKPDSVASGEAALALVAEKPFDVIFLDVQMPGLDGYATCEKIRETTVNRTTPVVFVTGQNDFQVRAQMSRSGGSDFVAKPFLVAEMTVKALTFALQRRLHDAAPAPAAATAVEQS